MRTSSDAGLLDAFGALPSPASITPLPTPRRELALLPLAIRGLERGRCRGYVSLVEASLSDCRSTNAPRCLLRTPLRSTDRLTVPRPRIFRSCSLGSAPRRLPWAQVSRARVAPGSGCRRLLGASVPLQADSSCFRTASDPDVGGRSPSECAGCCDAAPELRCRSRDRRRRGSLLSRNRTSHLPAGLLERTARAGNRESRALLSVRQRTSSPCRASSLVVPGAAHGGSHGTCSHSGDCSTQRRAPNSTTRLSSRPCNRLVAVPGKRGLRASDVSERVDFLGLVTCSDRAIEPGACRFATPRQPIE